MMDFPKVPARVGHCQVCRHKHDLRQLGPIENGVRLWICFGCGLSEGFDVMRHRLADALAELGGTP